MVSEKHTGVDPAAAIEFAVLLARTHSNIRQTRRLVAQSRALRRTLRELTRQRAGVRKAMDRPSSLSARQALTQIQNQMGGRRGGGPNDEVKAEVLKCCRCLMAARANERIVADIEVWATQYFSRTRHPLDIYRRIAWAVAEACRRIGKELPSEIAAKHQ